MNSQSHDFIKPFRDVKTTRPPRSVFSLDYFTQGTCSQGQLIPIFTELGIPNDTLQIGVQSLVRLLPMVAPAMTDISVFTHYFFVPYRLLWDNTKDDRWTTFINGGVTGDATPSLPRWGFDPKTNKPPDNSIGSLWDYFGFPTGIDLQDIGSDNFPIDMLRRAYNLIYNEYYRDQNLIPEVDLANQKILNRAWMKDYFTSALPWQQRGTPPLLGLSGTVPIMGIQQGKTTFSKTFLTGLTPYGGEVGADRTFATEPISSWNADHRIDLAIDFDKAKGLGISISQLRLANQIQEWLELNARGGARYTEYLKSHYGVSPSDSRLQRPEYIGGTKSPVIISEVLQTAPPSTDSPTPQGNMAGHGLTAQDGFVGTYHVEEWGLFMGIMSIMPKPVYSQGLPKKWMQRSPFDFYDPLFANLSDQPIRGREICLTNDNDYNRSTFGYQGAWDELRSNHNIVCGELRTSLSYWIQQRTFDLKNPPRLNADFINCNPAQTIFVQTDPKANNFIYTIHNIVKAIRPLPAMADPSLCNSY